MTSTMISSLTAQGWTFDVEHDTNHHTGAPETDYYAKSPRLNERFLRFSPIKEETLNGLLSAEREAYATQLLKKWNNTLTVRRAVAKALKAHPKGSKTLRVSITLKL